VRARGGLGEVAEANTLAVPSKSRMYGWNQKNVVRRSPLRGEVAGCAPTFINQCVIFWRKPPPVKQRDLAVYLLVIERGGRSTLVPRIRDQPVEKAFCCRRPKALQN